MEFSSISIVELRKKEAQDHFRKREFNERTITARIKDTLEFESYRELVHSFLEDNLAYSISVAERPRPLTFFRAYHSAMDEDRLVKFIAGAAEKDHRKTNHIWMDFRREYDNENLRAYFKETLNQKILAFYPALKGRVC